jgi:hypothetical protein
VLSFTADISPEVNAVVDQAVALLKTQGAEVIELAHYKPPKSLRDDELMVLLTELRVGLNAYPATTSATVRTLIWPTSSPSTRRPRARPCCSPRRCLNRTRRPKGWTIQPVWRLGPDSVLAVGPEGIDMFVADDRRLH